MNLNKVFLIGRLTADPELRSTTSGQSVTSFSIATNRYWTDKGGQKQDATEFHNVVAWAKLAEIATKFLKKGSIVLIEGRLQTRSWEDKQGQQRKSTEIVAESLQLGPRPAGGPRQTGGEAMNQSSSKEELPVVDVQEDINPENLPF